MSHHDTRAAKKPALQKQTERVSCPGPAPMAGSPFDHLDQETCDFYLRSLQLLDDVQVPYLVGGAYSLAYHAGLVRHTKALDVFVRPADAEKVLQMFDRE